MKVGKLCVYKENENEDSVGLVVGYTGHSTKKGPITHAVIETIHGGVASIPVDEIRFLDSTDGDYEKFGRARLRNIRNRGADPFRI